VITEQDTIQMIHLVQYNSRKHAFVANLVFVATFVGVVHNHPSGPVYIKEKAWKRQASFFKCHFWSKSFNHFRVDQSQFSFGRRRFRVTNNDNPRLNPDLGRGQAHSPVCIQNTPESFDKLGRTRIGMISLTALLPQAPVTIPPDHPVRIHTFLINPVIF